MTKRLSSLHGTHFILQNKNIFISVLHNFSHIWTLSPIPSKLEMNYSTTIVVITKFCHLLISHRRSLTRCHCWSTHKSLSRTSHPINSKNNSQLTKQKNNQISHLVSSIDRTHCCEIVALFVRDQAHHTLACFTKFYSTSSRAIPPLRSKVLDFPSCPEIPPAQLN